MKYCLQSCLLIVTLLLIGCSAKEENKPKEETALATPLFQRIDPETSGVVFNNAVPENRQMNILTYQYLHNGGGVSLGDINNDGLIDMYFTANFGPNHLYLNKGDMQFEEIGRTAGVGGKRSWCTGTTMVDINNDGLLDIYVSYSGKFNDTKRRNELFVNNGDLTFTERAKDYGIDDPSYSSQAAFFDYDRDGDLDLFVLNHSITPNQETNFFDITTKRNPLAGDKLYRNDDGHYTDISEQAGIIGNSIGYGLSVSTGDLNNDGWADLYVCNDYLEKDYLYINNQDGTFSEKIREKIKHISNFSMGSDIADFNNDGHLDIMVADMVAEDNYRIKTNMSGMSPERFYNAVDNGFHHQYMMNTLQMNNGDGSFSEVSQLAGLSSTDWSWAPLWADFDNDGHKDLLMTNGLRKEARNNDFIKRKKALLDSMKQDPEQQSKYMRQILGEMPEVPLKNYIFKNKGDINFENKTADWGLTEASFSNGAAYGDLDNDGDLDIVISNIDNAAFIYRNNQEQRTTNNFLNIKITGSEKNKSGLGTRIIIEEEDNVQMQEHYLSRGYLSSVADVLHFGLQDDTPVKNITIIWSDGRKEQLQDVAINQTLEITYDLSQKDEGNLAEKETQNTWFNQTTVQGINHVHQENNFNDFEKEILLPHKMSTLGPAVAKADVNADGLDDLFIGGAKGFASKLYIQQPNGSFITHTSNTWNTDRTSEDIAGAFFDADSDGDQDLYVVSGGNEFASDDPALQDRLYLNNGTGAFTKSSTALPKMNTSGGTIAPTDYDNDGDIDLFIGGRIIPGAYPKSPRSYLLQNNNGQFTDVTQNVAPQLLSPGLITTAIWSDYDNDGYQDLLVSGEWMPLMALKNNNGQFTDVSESLGLNDTQGWWYSLAQGDFDGDGDMDFLAGNLGLNYKYQATPDATFDIYFDDFDQNNTGDIVLTYENNGERFPLRGRECSSQQMPFIKEKFKTYDAFAKANLVDVLGEQKLNNALHLQAKTFASVYIENKGNEAWVITPLPRMAQVSSINDFVINDINKDGHQDIILAGNLYDSEVETPRNDAGNGLVLLGDGKGNFEATPMMKSGLYAPHNVKHLEELRINDNTYMAAINNNAPVQFFKLN